MCIRLLNVPKEYPDKSTPQNKHAACGHQCHFLSSQFPCVVQDQMSRLVLFSLLQSDRAGNEEIEDKSYQELLRPTSLHMLNLCEC